MPGVTGDLEGRVRERALRECIILQTHKSLSPLIPSLLQIYIYTHTRTHLQTARRRCGRKEKRLRHYLHCLHSILRCQALEVELGDERAKSLRLVGGSS